MNISINNKNSLSYVLSIGFSRYILQAEIRGISYCEVLVVGTTNSKAIIVISTELLLQEIIKHTLQEKGFDVVCVPDEKTAMVPLRRLCPRNIILCRPDTKVKGLDRFFRFEDYPENIIVIGQADDDMVTYSRSNPEEATLQNLIKHIREN